MCNEKDDDDDDDELKDVCPDCMEFCEKCNLSFHPFCQAGHRKTCHARGRAERAVLVRKRLSMARNEISKSSKRNSGRPREKLVKAEKSLRNLKRQGCRQILEK